MSTLRHLVFALSYVVVAVVVAAALPTGGEGGLPRGMALLIGLVILLAGALVHEFLARREAAEGVQARLAALEETVQQLADQLGRAAYDAAGRTAPSGVRQVMSETRVLETLANQLPTERAAARSAPAVSPARSPAPRAEPRAGAAQPLAARPLTAGAGPARSDQAMLDTVREAVRLDRVDMFLQPIVSLPQRKHRYYEVFTRIRDEAGTHITPDQYIAVAERENLIAAIDNYLLFRCIQLIRETEKRHQNVGFFCNISVATLNDTVFMREFLPFLAENTSLAGNLVFELAQADLMQGGVFQTGFLDGLRRLGYRFSMDQVDRLELNPDELARNEIRFVKLDAARLLDPQGRFSDPERVLGLKKALDRHSIDLIAEKIETDQQLLDVLDLYIDFGQGYLFGEPRIARRQG